MRTQWEEGLQESQGPWTAAALILAFPSSPHSKKYIVYKSFSELYFVTIARKAVRYSLKVILAQKVKVMVSLWCYWVFVLCTGVVSENTQRVNEESEQGIVMILRCFQHCYAFLKNILYSTLIKIWSVFVNIAIIIVKKNMFIQLSKDDKQVFIGSSFHFHHPITQHLLNTYYFWQELS